MIGWGGRILTCTGILAASVAGGRPPLFCPGTRLVSPRAPQARVSVYSTTPQRLTGF